jgi:hypothetical protein
MQHLARQSYHIVAHFLQCHSSKRRIRKMEANRPLTIAERRLARWMLEHGNTEAKNFLPQLENAEVTPIRCPCGCASICFQIKGSGEAPPGNMHPLGDFVFGPENKPSGIFIYEMRGLLSGIEVYGLAGDAPKSLPAPEELRPF